MYDFLLKNYEKKNFFMCTQRAQKSLRIENGFGKIHLSETGIFEIFFIS
jgi:hypothetical protein